MDIIDIKPILLKSIFVDKKIKKGAGRSTVHWKVHEEPMTYPEVLILNTNIEQLDHTKKIQFPVEMSLIENVTYELVSIVWTLQDLEQVPTTIAHIKITSNSTQTWYLFNNGKITIEEDPTDIHDKQYQWRRPCTLFYKKVVNITIEQALIKTNEQATIYTSIPGAFKFGLYENASLLATENEIRFNIQNLIHWYRQINNTGGMFSPMFDMFFRYVISGVNHLLQSNRAKLLTSGKRGDLSLGGSSSETGSSKLVGVMGYIQAIDSTQSKSRERFRGNLTRIYTDKETGMTMFASQKRSTSLDTSVSQDSSVMGVPNHGNLLANPLVNPLTNSLGNQPPFNSPLSQNPLQNSFPPAHDDDPDADAPNETSCLFRVTVSNDIEVLLDHFILNRACESVPDDRDLNGDGLEEGSLHSKDTDRTKFILKTLKYNKEYDLALLKYIMELVSGRSCIVYQTLKKLGMQNIDFVGNVIQQCIKYSIERGSQIRLV